MSRANLFIIIPICILLIGGSIALWAAMSNDDEEEKVPISDVPAKVLEAANTAVPGGTIIAVEKDIEDGELIYDVEKLVSGVTYEIEVTADGIVKEIEQEGEEDDDDKGESEESVALTDVPSQVLEAAKKAVPDGKIKKVEKEVGDGEVIYDVELVVTYEVEVTAEGVVKEIEKEGEDEEDNGGAEDDD